MMTFWGFLSVLVIFSFMGWVSLLLFIHYTPPELKAGRAKTEAEREDRYRE